MESLRDIVWHCSGQCACVWSELVLCTENLLILCCDCVLEQCMCTFLYVCLGAWVVQCACACALHAEGSCSSGSALRACQHLTADLTTRLTISGSLMNCNVIPTFLLR